MTTFIILLNEIVEFARSLDCNSGKSDDEFLRAHWISYFAYSRKKGDDYIYFLLNKFSAKNMIERFIFICFRLGYFNATFRSSVNT